MTSRTSALLAGSLLIASMGSAQTPAATPAQKPAAVQASVPTQPATESPAYTYDPQGRRDPFVSLLRRGSDLGARNASRPAGISGLEVGEVTLKGTMESRTGYVALVEGADKKTYIVKTGDRMVDGTVQVITANTMVILQQVNDPLSLEKVREVRKMLRQTDEVK